MSATTTAICFDPRTEVSHGNQWVGPWAETKNGWLLIPAAVRDKEISTKPGIRTLITRIIIPIKYSLDLPTAAQTGSMQWPLHIRPTGEQWILVQMEKSICSESVMMWKHLLWIAASMRPTARSLSHLPST